MTDISSVTPASQQSGLPTPPAGAPAAQPAQAGAAGEPAAQPAPVQPAKPGMQPAPELAASPVNAQSAASDAAQAAIAAQQAAAEAAQAPAAEPAPAAAQAGASFNSGNDAFDQAGALLAEKGVANYAEILAAAAEGRMSLSQKVQLTEKLGVNTAQMVVNSLEAEITRQEQVAAAAIGEAKAAVAKELGMGADQADAAWAHLQEFVSSPESGLSDADRDLLNDMITAGGAKASMALRDVTTRLRQSPGFTQVPTLLSGDGPTQSGFQTLTKEQYQRDIQETVKKFGYNSPEAEALRNRRSMSIQRGI